MLQELDLLRGAWWSPDLPGYRKILSRSQGSGGATPEDRGLATVEAGQEGVVNWLEAGQEGVVNWLEAGQEGVVNCRAAASLTNIMEGSVVISGAGSCIQGSVVISGAGSCIPDISCTLTELLANSSLTKGKAQYV